MPRANPPWPKPTEPEPDDAQLERWLLDIEFPDATDGCMHIDIDGTCEHGYPSWILFYRLV